MRHRHRERAAIPVRVHQFLEARVLPPVARRDPDLRPQTLLPQAIAVKTLLRHGTEIALVIGRTQRPRIALQHAQFSEQFAYGNRFDTGQGQVVGGEWAGTSGCGEAARIATGLAGHLDQQKIVETGPGQFPARGKAADATADDQYRNPPGLARRRERIGTAAAQAMARLGGIAEHAAGRQ